MLASGYIVLVASLIRLLADKNPVPTPDTLFAPMLVLSALVLSVCVMGYLMVLEPSALFLDGKRAEAVSFFFKSVGTFAVITAVLYIINFAFFG